MPRIGAGKPYALNKERRMRKERRTKCTGGQPVIHEGSSKQMVKVVSFKGSPQMVSDG